MPTKYPRARSRRGEEQRLAREVRRFAGRGPESCSPEEWTTLLESYRLQILYPGQFVAFRDHYRQDGESLWLVQREVLGHSRNLVKAQKCIMALPDEEKRGVFLDYIEGPDAPLHGT